MINSYREKNVFEAFEDSDSRQALNVKIELNEASLEELDFLPCIGKKTAMKIIEFRQKNKFNSIEDLRQVEGIGDKKFRQISKWVYVKDKDRGN